MHKQDISSFAETEFQKFILGAIQGELIPELNTRQIDPNFMKLLKGINNYLCNDSSWTTVLSAKQQFCWGVLATCCSKIPLSEDSFEWVIGGFSKLNLGKVYQSYAHVSSVDAHDSVTINQSSHNMNHGKIYQCSSDDVDR